MKKSLQYFLPVILILISCAGHSDISPEVKLNTSQPIKSKIAIFVTPTSDEIKKIKAETKDLEGFYVAADDYLFYRSQAMTFLEKNKISYKLTHEKKIKFKVGKTIFESDNSQSGEAWFVLLYNGKEKPVKTFSIDVDSYKDYLK